MKASTLMITTDKKMEAGGRDASNTYWLIIKYHVGKVF
jgi:hypothetical protein